MPAVTQMMREERPGSFVILIGEQNPDPTSVHIVAHIVALVTVQSPNNAQEQWAGTRHD